MRYARIFLLHLENLLEHRSRSFVWFLISIFNPMLLLLFWRGAFQGQNTIPASWTFSAIASYYFLLAITSALLTSHIEEDVAREDIAQGQLVRYLTRPFSYYWFKFFEEIPYRILQGFFGIVACIFFILAFGNIFTIASNPLIIILAIITCCIAFLLSFTFKMIIGLLAFWIIDVGGFFQLVEVIMLIFAGYILPIELLPSGLKSLAILLPFSYMIYFPITVLEGKYAIEEVIRIIIIQMSWLFILSVIYRRLWNMGLRKFTAVGQ